MAGDEYDSSCVLLVALGICSACLCQWQGNVIWMLQTIAAFLGMGHSLKRLAYAQTLEEQQEVWNSNWFVKFCKQGNSWLVEMAVRFLALIFLNRFVLWCVLQLQNCMASSKLTSSSCIGTACCLKVLLLSTEGQLSIPQGLHP